jgi:hypothetical protein
VHLVCAGFTVDADGICPDDDGDLVCDAHDNCPLDPNAGQEDRDGDAVGDACDPEPATCPPVAPEVAALYGMHFSASPDRRQPEPLDGALVGPSFYPFIDHPTDIAAVEFWVDRPMIGAPDRTEKGRPYDVAGGSVDLAHVVMLAGGPHRIDARVTLHAGAVHVVCAGFVVDAGGTY